MKKRFFLVIFLMATLIASTKALAADVPKCDGLIKALEKIPPDSPGYAKILESAQSDCKEALEHAALIALYYSTNGSGWIEKSDWLDETKHHCSWYGVLCDENNNVIALFLSANNLTGRIPPEIGNLSYLDLLSFGYNQLTGPIPPELGNLTNLYFLYLHSNQLTGSIPPELGNLTNLYFLYLHSNQLTGSIPLELGDLANLSLLVLYGNQLTGQIPPELGNLVNLSYLNLSFNQLAGQIPSELGNLSNLGYMSLRDNLLMGCISTNLANLSGLEFLFLQNNNFSGWESQSALDWALTINNYEGPEIVATSCP